MPYKVVFSIASIFAIRMLGLFLILPIFALYASELPDATPFLVGLVLGIYGLTQACLQIPFGMLSDRYGRKSIITLGLLVFILGSVIAAQAASAENFLGIIIGRGLQGAGAISSVLFALITDLTTQEQRTKAMAMLGMTIGLSFFIAMILSPILNTWIDVDGIFWLMGLLAFISLIIVHTLIPSATEQTASNSSTLLAIFKSILNDTQLQRLYGGIFCLHAVLTANFVIVPILLENAGLLEEQQWIIYPPILILSFLFMLPFLIYAEKYKKTKTFLLGAISLLILAHASLWLYHYTALALGVGLFLFFTGFNWLEANLPALISKTAPALGKGTAMGAYSSCQFLGVFFGGLLGGWMASLYGANGLFISNILILMIWLSFAVSMKKTTS